MNPSHSSSDSSQLFSPPTPPWSGAGKKMESMMRKAIYEYDMIDNDDETIAVALSGGKDSLTLLFLLSAISGRGLPPFKIVAIHVAGAFSCGAGVGNTYIDEVCRSLNIPLIRKESKKTLENLECYSCSRERRGLIFQAAKESGATKICFGHHKDDNAQTLLMNLLHKGEFAGLLPKIKMVKYGITILRPLIFIGEQEITIFARQYGFRRITCRCPVGQNSMRRQTDELITSMEDIYPHARDNLSQASLLYGSNKAQDPQD